MSEEHETSPEEQAELDEIACMRADALRTGVVVAGFAGSGRAQIFDVELREGDLELVPVASVPIVTPD